MLLLSLLLLLYIVATDYKCVSWFNNMDAYKLHREKARRELHKNDTNYFEQIQDATSHKATAV